MNFAPSEAALGTDSPSFSVVREGSNATAGSCVARTGLQIIAMHGGRIWVESTLGKGSTFRMELPTRAEFSKRAP